MSHDCHFDIDRDVRPHAVGLHQAIASIRFTESNYLYHALWLLAIGVSQTRLEKTAVAKRHVLQALFVSSLTIVIGWAILYIPCSLRACLHGAGRPQVGEVTRFGG